MNRRQMDGWEELGPEDNQTTEIKEQKESKNKQNYGTFSSENNIHRHIYILHTIPIRTE